VDELVDIAGGTPVFPELRAAALGRDRIVDAAAVAQRDPEIIVASWCGKAVRKERIATRAGWSEVSAIRANRIHEIKSAYILQPGPAALLEGVRQLHAIIASAVDVPVDPALAPRERWDAAPQAPDLRPPNARD
jgi:iron complex transport system substrate-binding protein